MLLLLVSAGALPRLALAATYPNPPQLWWVPDDSYYYFRVALNFHEVGYFTFDGLNPTNGFQPLWQAILIGLATFATDKVLFVRLTLGASAVLSTLAAFPMFSYVRLRSTREAAFVAVSVWLFMPGLIAWQMSGMENALYVLALVLFLLVWTRRALLQVGDYGILAVATGLLFLSRVDSAIFVLLVYSAGLISAAVSRHRQDVKRILTSGAISFLLVGPYLAYNVAEFGQFLPVSGVVKVWDGIRAFRASVDGAGLAATLIYNSIDYVLLAKFHAAQALVEVAQGGLTRFVAVGLWLILVIWLGGYMVWTAVRMRERLIQGRPGLPSMRSLTFVDVAFASFIVVHTGLNVTVFASSVGHSAWYLAPLFVMAVLWAPSLAFQRAYLDWLRERVMRLVGSRRELSATLVRAFAVGATGYVLVSSLAFDARRLAGFNGSAHWTSASLELIDWVDRNLPPRARIGAWDAGLWGHYYEAGITNLDGVINSPEYLSVLRSGEIEEYLVSEGIDYLIVFDAWDQCRQYHIAPCTDGRLLYRTPEFPVSHLDATYIKLIELR